MSTLKQSAAAFGLWVLIYNIQVITATDKTDKSQIRMESNVVLCPDTEEEELPDIFFTKISASEGSTEGQWDGNDRPECYKNKFQESKEPGAKITFSWWVLVQYNLSNCNLKP